MRKCVNCKKVIPEKEGVILLRGASFACKDCHKKNKADHKNAEICEFC